MRRWASSLLQGLTGVMLLAVVPLALGGCSKPMQMGKAPNIVIPLERKPPPGDAPPPVKPAAEQPPAVHQAPDPTPSRSTAQVDLTFRFEAGHLHLLGSQRVTLETAEATPRRIGRFAAELWLGTELIERLRFDVPLLAADGGEALEAGLVTDVTIRLPLLERANRLEIVDRKTEGKLTLEWPPS